jgi:hypothetical protein
MTTEERNGLGSALRTADDVAAASELADTVVNDADTTGNTAASMQPVKESEYDVMGATDVDASDRIGIKVRHPFVASSNAFTVVLIIGR